MRANYLLYARLLVSVARETRLSRFRLTEKRDLQMLKEVAALFDTPHVFTLLRGLGEGIEQLLVTQALPQASPLHQSLIEQLTIFEGADSSRWHTACEVRCVGYDAWDTMCI